MSDFARDIVEIRIEDEMKHSYMDYSMSVIIGRALPDVRDGLKPVHRRILYAMHVEGLGAGKKYSKCAGVVGEVLKKYHPHGDSAVYDALVRMAQPWNLRYPLVDGQGNFGSVDGDPAAAYRYTECRMTRIAEELLADIDKETVEFSPNFDGTTEEPDVLPARVPNLLVNGADGIAVGMATKIPPHNLREIVDACIRLVRRPETTLEELMMLDPTDPTLVALQGPDFPTGGTIYGRLGIREAYETGRGRVVVRGRATEEEVNGRRAIIIDEIPFQVNKARLVEQIAELVKDKKLDGIAALRDESDRTGMRVVIELKRDAYYEVVLANLYKHTALQSTFGVILLSIVNQQPRILSIKEMMQLFIGHRREVILRRTRYEQRKAREREHILDGFRKALDALDAIIALIRASPTPADAREGLVLKFGLTSIQADAVLEMRLQRLTGMERDKILGELAEVRAYLAELELILGTEKALMDVVEAELVEVRDAWADERRTRIVDASGDVDPYDLIAAEDQVVTFSHLGYIKRCSPNEWRMQKRGGLGKQGMATRDEDFVTQLFIANTHSLLMVFTTKGRVFPLPVHTVPEAARTAKGRPIVNLVQLPEGEKIAAVVSLPDLHEEAELLFVTRAGYAKRTSLELFKNLRAAGLIASSVDDGDELVRVEVVRDPNVDVMLLSRRGKCIRFPFTGEKGLNRDLGRNARGVQGMQLGENDEIVDALLVPPAPESEDVVEDEAAAEESVGEGEAEVDEVAEPEDPNEATLLSLTTLGFGKRVPLGLYRRQGRRGKGILSFKLTGESGDVVGAMVVTANDQLMLATDSGRVIKIRAGEVRRVQRVARGVRLMKLEKGERVVDVARLAEAEEVLAAAVPAAPPEPDADVE